MCKDPSVLSIILLIKYAINIIRTIVPIILIILLAIDLSKGVIDPSDNKIKKVIINRFVMCLLIFFVPFFVNIAISFVSSDKYSENDCYKNAEMSTIESLRETEKAGKESYKEKVKYNNEKARAAEKEELEKRNAAASNYKEEPSSSSKPKSSTSFNPNGNSSSSSSSKSNAKVNKNNVCFYAQGNYSNTKYDGISGATIASHGCGPTSCAVIACTLKGDKSYTPVRVTKEICNMKNACFSSGTSLYALIDWLKKEGFTAYYVSGKSTAREDFNKTLNNGGMILIYITGHYYVLYGYHDGYLDVVEVGDSSKNKKPQKYEDVIKPMKGYIIVKK